MLQPPQPSVVSIVLAATVVIVVAIDCRATPVPEAKPVSLDVHVKLTDLDYAPIAGVDGRLVFGSEPDWQRAGAGLRFVTDARGEYRVTAPVVLDTRMRRLPTNFVDSLASRDQATDHLLVGAELGYMTFRWLYVVDVYRFPGGGAALLDPPAVYTPDAHDDFTNKALQDSSGWHMPELGKLVLTGPGFEPWDFLLQPDPADQAQQHWTLRLAFKRSPAPVIR